MVMICIVSLVYLHQQHPISSHFSHISNNNGSMQREQQSKQPSQQPPRPKTPCTPTSGPTTGTRLSFSLPRMSSALWMRCVAASAAGSTSVAASAAAASFSSSPAVLATTPLAFAAAAAAAALAAEGVSHDNGLGSRLREMRREEAFKSGSLHAVWRGAASMSRGVCGESRGSTEAWTRCRRNTGRAHV